MPKTIIQKRKAWQLANAYSQVKVGFYGFLLSVKGFQKKKKLFDVLPSNFLCNRVVKPLKLGHFLNVQCEFSYQLPQVFESIPIQFWNAHLQTNPRF